MSKLQATFPFAFSKGLKKTIIFSQTIPEENNEDEVFDDDAIEDVDLEELEYAFDHFLDKLEALV